jgi:uncharacterized protein (DUF1778 family)
MPKSISPRDERIDLRLSSDMKALLARAAAYSGMSLSGFLVASAAGQAKALIAENESLTLSPSDWNAFLTALDETDKPRPKLAAAFERYDSRRNIE